MAIPLPPCSVWSAGIPHLGWGHTPKATLVANLKQCDQTNICTTNIVSVTIHCSRCCIPLLFYLADPLYISTLTPERSRRTHLLQKKKSTWYTSLRALVLMWLIASTTHPLGFCTATFLLHYFLLPLSSTATLPPTPIPTFNIALSHPLSHPPSLLPHLSHNTTPNNNSNIKKIQVCVYGFKKKDDQQ